MSADSWGSCPACKASAIAAHEVLLAQVAEAYGKVPVEEFDALRIKATRGVDFESLRTFREDYEVFGAETGMVVVSYSGHCTKCSAGVDFTHTVPVEMS